jgi:hypothetical protein
MDEEERANLLGLQQTKLRRLRVLEQQAATFGNSTRPEIVTEIEDLQRELSDIAAKLNVSAPAIDRVALQQLRRQAVSAYYRKQWTQAVDLLEQVVKAVPSDDDSRMKLVDAQRWLRLEEDYDAICELRDAGEEEAVLNALYDLENQWPGFPDPQGIQQWIEDRRKRKQGKTVLRRETTDDALLAIWSSVHGKSGYQDASGNIVIEYQFDWAQGFSEGLAAVEVDGKWGYINMRGRRVIRNRFDVAQEFSEGLAAVKVDDMWGYINKRGSSVIEPQFDDAKRFSEGLAAVRIRFKSGYIDKNGRLVIEPQFNEANEFSEGLAAVKVGGKWGYIDKRGGTVIEPQFAGAKRFSEGLAAVMVDWEWGYIDRRGRIVIRARFSEAGEFSEGLASVRVGNTWKRINKIGDYIKQTT